MAKATRASASSSVVSGTASSGGGSGTGGAGGGVNPAPIVPPVVLAITPFAFTPGKSNAAVPIDYTSTTGIKLFNSAIMKLPELFDGESKSINLFNEKLPEREKKLGGWRQGQISS